MGIYCDSCGIFRTYDRYDHHSPKEKKKRISGSDEQPVCRRQSYDLIGKIYAIDDDSKQVTLNVGTDESETLIVIDKNAIATVIDSKNKPKTEEKPKKPNLGINKKHHDESVDDTSATESTNDITLGNTEDVSIDSKEDVKIDNNEDIKF